MSLFFRAASLGFLCALAGHIACDTGAVATPRAAPSSLTDGGGSSSVDASTHGDAAAGMSAPETVEDMKVAQTLTEKLAYHAVQKDAAGKLLSPFPGPGSFTTVSKLAWDAMKRVPVLDNGYPTYFTHSVFISNPTNTGPELGPPVPDPAPHCRAGFVMMIIDSALAWFAYSGDRSVIDLTRKYADFVIANSMTLPTDNWSNVPYATANPHAIVARGADVGDGDGNLEIDKMAEMALGLVRLFEHSGDARYRDVALQVARELAKHVRQGDASKSPWPFRVDAKTGANISQEYTAHIIPMIALFAELELLGLSETGFKAARETAWKWLLDHPMKTNIWAGYFEDIGGVPAAENRTQYISLETARWMLLHRDADPDALVHARGLIDWTAQVLGADGPPADYPNHGNQHGAEAISEQEIYPIKMGSHTSRFGSVLALYASLTGDQAIRERAFRSLNWATYLTSSTGIVSDFPREIPKEPTYSWFTDGYGDYIKHLMAAVHAMPAWAPANEDHLLGSSSIVKSVSYNAEGVHYTTSRAAADDVLRLTKAPASVLVGTTALGSDPQAPDRFTVQPVSNGGVIVRVHRGGTLSGEVTVLR